MGHIRSFVLISIPLLDIIIALKSFCNTIPAEAGTNFYIMRDLMPIQIPAYKYNT